MVALDELLLEMRADRQPIACAVEEEADRPYTVGPDGLRSTKGFLQ